MADGTDSGAIAGRTATRAATAIAVLSPLLLMMAGRIAAPTTLLIREALISEALITEAFITVPLRSPGRKPNIGAHSAMFRNESSPPGCAAVLRPASHS